MSDKQRVLKTLTQAYHDPDDDQGTPYAVCGKCKQAWVDDYPVFGSLTCPNKCGFVLLRGVFDPAAHGCGAVTCEPGTNGAAHAVESHHREISYQERIENMIPHEPEEYDEWEDESYDSQREDD